MSSVNFEPSAFRGANTEQARFIEATGRALGIYSGQSFDVSSSRRTPYDQARIMYDNSQATGLKYQYDQYGPLGDQVIRLFEKNKDLPRDQVIAKAEKLIANLESKGQFVSQHLGSAQDRNGTVVLDVPLSSIRNPEALRAAALKAGATKVLNENGVLHIEIPKAKARQLIDKVTNNRSLNSENTGQQTALAGSPNNNLQRPSNGIGM
jgi:hypothetical protein